MVEEEKEKVEEEFKILLQLFHEVDQLLLEAE